MKRKEIIKFLKNNKIVLASGLVLLIVGIYHSVSRYYRFLVYPELLEVFLIPYALVCGSGVFGAPPISSLICSDFTLLLSFLLEGVLIGYIAQKIHQKVKSRTKH